MSHTYFIHNKKVILQIIPNMHETKSVHTESSELCHQVSTQKVLDLGASWILDFWMRMLKPTIQWC